MNVKKMIGAALLVAGFTAPASAGWEHIEVYSSGTGYTLELARQDALNGLQEDHGGVRFPTILSCYRTGVHLGTRFHCSSYGIKSIYVED